MGPGMVTSFFTVGAVYAVALRQARGDRGVVDFPSTP
jgi:hypothetical protein